MARAVGGLQEQNTGDKAGCVPDGIWRGDSKIAGPEPPETSVNKINPSPNDERGAIAGPPEGQKLV
jgi:hypothetical protein